MVEVSEDQTAILGYEQFDYKEHTINEWLSITATPRGLFFLAYVVIMPKNAPGMAGCSVKLKVTKRSETAATHIFF